MGEAQQLGSQIVTDSKRVQTRGSGGVQSSLVIFQEEIRNQTHLSQLHGSVTEYVFTAWTVIRKKAIK